MEGKEEEWEEGKEEGRKGRKNGGMKEGREEGKANGSKDVTEYESSSNHCPTSQNTCNLLL